MTINPKKSRPPARHPRAGGDPVRPFQDALDSRLRGNDSIFQARGNHASSRLPANGIWRLRGNDGAFRVGGVWLAALLLSACADGPHTGRADRDTRWPSEGRSLGPPFRDTLERGPVALFNDAGTGRLARG